MRDPYHRPSFYEGEVLPAADLTATVDYARDQMARHERLLHSWGIVNGLALAGTGKSLSVPSSGGGTTTIKYVEVTLRAGAAIDGSGREIVVPEDAVLGEDQFAVADPSDTTGTTMYPVFLVGKDAPAPAAQSLSGLCEQGLSTRIDE